MTSDVADAGRTTKWRASGPCAIVVVAALTSSLFSPRVLAAVPASSQPAPQPPVGLELHIPSEREIATGDTHRYRLRLAAGVYASVTIDQHGIDIGAALLDPAGVTVVAERSRRPGTITLSIIARLRGTYLLDVWPLETVPACGRYVAALRMLRSAQPADVTRLTAERLFATAESLRYNSRAETTKRALSLYLRACTAWRSVGDRASEAQCTTSASAAHFALGDSDAAIRGLDRSLRAARAAGDADVECTTLGVIGRISVDLGRMEEARGGAAAALQLGRRIPNPVCEAEALTVQGDIIVFTGRERDAIGVFQQALALLRDQGNRRGQARLLVNLGYVFRSIGDPTQAQTSFGSALSMARSAADAAGEAAALAGFGHLYYVVGERQTALNYYKQARELFEKLGDRAGMANMLDGTGVIHLTLGAPEVSLGYFRRAVDLFGAMKLASGEADARFNTTECLVSLGRLEEAFREAERVLQIARTTSNRRAEDRALQHMGRVKAALGDLPAAMQYYEASRQSAAAVGDLAGEIYALNGMTDLLHRQRRDAEALSLLDRALETAREAHNPIPLSLTLFNLARVKAGLGDLENALAEIHSSLRLVEGLRNNVANLDLRASYLASVRDRQDLEIELLTRLHEREPGRGYDALAFEASERARARSLLDGLAEARASILQGVDAALLDRERSVRHALNAKAQRMAALPRDALHEKELAALGSDIDALTADYREVEAQIRVASPAYAALTQPQPLTLVEVQQLVADDDTVLVEYFLGERRSYVWTVTRTSSAMATLPPRDEVDRMARPYIDAMGRRGGGSPPTRESSVVQDKRAREISATLLGPIVAHMRVRRVLLVPDGILHTLPFAALPDPDASSAERGVAPPLIDTHDLVFLPSASTLALLRRDWHHDGKWPKAVMVFADPVFDADDPRLDRRAAGVGHASPAGRPVARSNDEGPGTLRQLDETATNGIARLLGSRREARAIAASAPGVDVALDFAANREAVLNPRLTDYRIIHFATHGVVDNSRPALSGIILSLFDEKGRSEPGFLRLHDIYNLKLPVDLVVLSACSTGLGKEVAGEGLMGLVRGFMYAGSRQVLATLWKVDDQATSELMTRFYDGVLRHGLRPVTALAEAQRQMMRDPRWRDPFYWAPFVLQGDWQ